MIEGGVGEGDRDDVEGGEGRTSSVNAVVATAFATPLDPANGIRPPENFEEADTRVEAREPGLRVLGVLLKFGDEVAPARTGDGGGGGELAGGGVRSLLGKGKGVEYCSGLATIVGDSVEGA